MGEEMVVADFLRHLPDDRRDAFVLTQIIGLTYAEAARAADCPVGTIRSRVARARETLVGLWREIDADSPVAQAFPRDPGAHTRLSGRAATAALPNATPAPARLAVLTVRHGPTTEHDRSQESSS
ncbi:sigma factor-like helix-turn-helix DNA-binding protein [Nocardia sp. NPDC004568]|uniref:sigma factor-like helix-turn-helix DNA-binding protein n=1 Tax=Nocardia sp. NPDC004568 TaxID=3154551 RepID=UPI0033BC1FE3